MKKKLYIGLLALEALICLGLVLAQKSSATPSLFAFPLGLMAQGLRQLSLSGAAGNLAAWFIYILICNYSGLLPFAGQAPGFQAPTSDINFPAGLAVMVIILVQLIGIREHRGLGTYKRMFQPFVFIFPLVLMDELAKPISLTFRLYGNTFGDEQVVDVLRELCPVLLPVVMQFLVVILALIQAVVFALLTAIYIGEAVEKETTLPIDQH